MNISLKWLKQYLDFDLTAQEVGDALTSLGLEVGAVEEVETIRGGLKGLVVSLTPIATTCISPPLTWAMVRTPCKSCVALLMLPLVKR